MSEVAEVEAPEVVNVVSSESAQQAFAALFDGLKEGAEQAGMKSVFAIVDTNVFMALRGFGLNRDVTKRLAAKANTHLKGELTSHQQNKVAVVLTSAENGADFWKESEPFMKIDGHSRCAAWEAGQLAKPDFVHVEIFFGLSDAQIHTEYSVFTESKAQATQAEKNDIQNKLHGYHPVSEFCQSSWKNAFNVAGYKKYEKGLELFRKPLEIIDSWMMKSEKGKNSTKRQVSGIRAAMLKTFDSEDCTFWEIFWLDFFKDESQLKSAIELREWVKAQKGAGSDYDETVRDEAERLFNVGRKADRKAKK